MAAKAGRVQIQLEAQVAKLQQDLDKATRIIENDTKRWKNAFTSVFAGNIASDFFNRLTGAMSQTIKDLGDIADKSQALGDTAEMFQRLAYAADQTGVAMDTIVSASGKLQRNLGEGTEKTAKALGMLGTSIEDLRKLSTGDAFIKVAGALGNIKDAALQAQIGAAVFGKGWQALLPLAAQGEAALRQMTQQAQVASNEAVKAADDYGDAVAAMQGAVKVFIAEALAPLLPLLTKSAQEFTNVAGAASGAADGVDRSTSSARELGITLATMMQGLTGFREVLNELQTASVSAFKGWQWPWEDDAPKKVNDLSNAWSRMVNSFAGVSSTVTTTAEVTNAAKAAADAATAAAKAAEAQAKADAKATEAKQKKVKVTHEDKDAIRELIAAQKQLDDVQRKVEEKQQRVISLLDERTLAQMRANGATEQELELERMRMEGASATEIRITRDIQMWDAAGAAAAERQQQAAEQAQMYADTVAHGFEDIFFAMTEGSESATEAVKRLVIELTTLFLTQKALQALGFNQNGSWGFQGVAKGAAFDMRGMMRFAQGGIVTGPTPFTFGGGRLGVMGEAGPEAVLPLSRDSSGKLGVRGGAVNVTVHNYGGAKVETRQNGGDLQIVIDQVRGALASDIARGGNVLSGALEGTYQGLRR